MQLKHIPLTAESIRCSTCTLGQICLPVGMAAEDARKMDELVQERIRLEKGQTLFSVGTPLLAVYGVRYGTLKTSLELSDGRQQITGFHLPGEIVGLDGIGEAHHASTAVALEDTEVCTIRMDHLSTLANQLPSLQQQFFRLMGKEILADQQMLLTVGTMRAEERLAAFLLSMSMRLQARGYSPSEFVLRMSREEIGSFLGLKLETVSRLFSRFAKAGLLRIQQRQVQIVDMQGLKQLLGQPC